jgi:predicted esterase
MLQVNKKTIENDEHKPIVKTINRTIKTAKLIDAFWERWLVHGVDLMDLNKIQSDLQNLEHWLLSWEKLAHSKELQAKKLEKQGFFKEAEYLYRQTSLYYNLNYWIDPMFSEQKQYWYNKSLKFIKKADELSGIKTLYTSINIDDGSKCSGRIRIPNNPKGCILIINPIDSSKEELFKYEMEFVEAGFATLSFDGPGQGETFIMNEVIGTRNRWEQFINQLIDYTSIYFEELPIYLFGTSLGASWVLYGSSHKKVSKAVAVSPAIELEKMNMPTYFMERMDCSIILKDKDVPIPYFDEINYQSHVLLFHGKKDMMVPNDEMDNLFQKIEVEKHWIEYENEGHCCNNKLDEIRKLSLQWFSNKSIAREVNLI